MSRTAIATESSMSLAGVKSAIAAMATSEPGRRKKLNGVES